MIVVIADDLTGAAEMAGIAWRNGCQVGFLVIDERLGNNTRLRIKEARLRGIDVFVVATNCRSQNTTEAVHTIQNVMEGINADKDILFKKTDSALRGHIVAEISVMLKTLGIRKSLLLPQNPSKKRTIEKGVFRICGVELHQTAFRFDPEYPISTSNVEEVLTGTKSLSIEEDLAEGINIADASDANEVQLQLNKATTDTLIAGGADLFEAFLLQNSVINSFDNHLIHSNEESGEEITGLRRKSFPTERARKPLLQLSESCIVVCGSTQSKPIQLGFPISLMPENVYHGASAENWIQSACLEYSRSHSIVIGIGNHTEMIAQYANRLKETLSIVVCSLLDVFVPELIIIEGGATAYALLSRMEIRQIEVREEIAPGVVCLSVKMASNNINVIVKPGSYPWRVIR